MNSGTLIKTENPDTLKLLHLNKVCRSYIFINKYNDALLYANKAIELSNEILKRDFDSQHTVTKKVAQRGNAVSNNMIGVINMNLGNYPDALVNYFKALKLFEELNDKKGIAYALENIGIVYEHQGDLKKALSNFELSLKIKREINDLPGIANSLENIGTLYEHLNEYDEAIKNHRDALEISKNLNDKNGMANS